MTKTMRTIDDIPIGTIYLLDEDGVNLIWLKVNSNYIVGGPMEELNTIGPRIRRLSHNSDYSDRLDFEATLIIEELLYRKWNEYKLTNILK